MPSLYQEGKNILIPEDKEMLRRIKATVLAKFPLVYYNYLRLFDLE